MIPQHLQTLPLVAILRGLTPDEAVAIGEALFDAGFRCLEVPLNSPDPLRSIERLADRFGESMLVGAGTVLTPGAVNDVKAAGGRIIISPNADPAVIAHAKAEGLVSLPGVFTPTEAFAALAAGADGLKLFPAEVAGTAGLKALKAVLPTTAAVFAVGGVDPESFPAWRQAGAGGFGIGSALYRPGDSPETVAARAHRFVEAWSADR
ncbi:MAG: 2-dehydro-3-deoxy-6-phosphogalactonate aldolase [Brevundimonas sp.]